MFWASGFFAHHTLSSAMAPKKKSAAQASEKSDVPASATAAANKLAAQGERATNLKDDVNSDYMTKFAAALARVMDHRVFKGAVAMQPKGIDAREKEFSGYQSAFKAADCAIALKSVQRYEAAGNLFWLNLSFTATPGTPYNTANIMRLKEHTFSKPSRLPFAMVIACESDCFTPEGHKGALMSVSPEEVLHAYIFAVDEAISGKASKEELNKWLAVALTTTMTFEVLPSHDDRYFRAVNLREDLKANYRTMSRTTFQWVFLIMNFKEAQDKSSGCTLSALKVSDLYKTRCNMAPDSEPLSKDYIDRALTVYKSLLSVPYVRAALEYCEESYGVDGPFNSMAAMHVLTTRTFNNKDKAWVVQGIIDLVRMGMVDKQELSARVLSGGADAGSKKGYADVILYKKAMKDYLLGEFRHGRRFAANFIEKAKTNLSSHEDFRKTVAAYPGEVVADRSWVASARKSGELFVQLFQDVVYSKDLDPVLKTAVKNKKICAEACAYQALKERIDDIDAELAKENAAPEGTEEQQQQQQEGGASTSKIMMVQESPVKFSKPIALPEDREQYWYLTL